jgi:hypothetical protein
MERASRIKDAAYVPVVRVPRRARRWKGAGYQVQARQPVGDDGFQGGAGTGDALDMLLSGR